MSIQQLEPDVAAKIAAGEVIERPASVVKELIENSIDAGATSIRVELLEGGLQLIRVTDDGCGIDALELPLALSRHATSKLQTIDDLEHIRSLGFRGEALASVAAVADVTLISCTKDAIKGASIHTSNGNVLDIEPAATSKGTTVTVRNLFMSVPARLKFLKSRSTEVAHSHHLLEQYAFAYPEIRFSITSEGRELFTTSGNGHIQQVLIDMYGIEIARQMVPLIMMETMSQIEVPVVSGYISLPTCFKGTRQHLSFFVNRRWVLSRMLTYAVEEAYHSLLLKGRHPIVVLNITIDPSLLDINVHPAKTEIRFLKERLVYVHVLRAVRQALLENTHVAHLDHKMNPSSAETQFPSIGQSLDFSLPASPWMTTNENSHSPPDKLWQSHLVERYIAKNIVPAMSTLLAPLSVIPSSSIDEIHEQVVSSIAVATKLPPLRVIGQVLQSYVVSEGPDGLYIVDQHAAHERILLERMVIALHNDEQASQLLLTPLPLQCAPAERSALEDQKSLLHSIGFELQIEENDIYVKAVPILLLQRLETFSLQQLLFNLVSFEQSAHTETWEEHALADVACKAAIKAHHFLTVHEMCELLEQLEQTQSPLSCCHGRPTIARFDSYVLERMFEIR